MIEANWASYIAEDLRRAGHALDGPLKEAGLSRHDVANPEGRIPYAAYVGLIERAALLLGRPDYGLKLGASRDVRDSGLVGFIALNSPTLGAALANVERYINVSNEGIDVVFARLGSGGGVLRFRDTEAPMRHLRHHAEQSMAVLVTGVREMTAKRAVPLYVEFTHAAPDEPVDYQSILGCPVRFGAAWDAAVFPEEALRLPVTGADNKLLRVLEAACRRIIGRRPGKGDLVHSVREYVVQRLKNGAPAFDDVASHFNMSPKTLERRLAERNASYRDLVDSARRDLAKHYLASTDLRLHQIAYVLGYSEPAPLVRAFRRWTDTTPMRFRERHR